MVLCSLMVWLRMCDGCRSATRCQGQGAWGWRVGELPSRSGCGSAPGSCGSLLVVREDVAVLDVGEGGVDVVGVDRGDQRCQLLGQALDHVAREEGVPCRGVGEPEDEGGVEALVVGVVVGDVRGVPELLDPGQERLRAQFLQHTGAGECGDELLLDELPETTRAGPVP